MKAWDRILRIPAVRFAAAGSVGWLTYYGLLIFLTEVAKVWYLASAMTALIVNYAITFVLQKVWTFRDTSTHILHQQIGIYVCMVTGFYISNSVLLYALVEYARLWYLFAQVLISLLLTVVSFAISRWLFKTQPPAAR